MSGRTEDGENKADGSLNNRDKDGRKMVGMKSNTPGGLPKGRRADRERGGESKIIPKSFCDSTFLVTKLDPHCQSTQNAPVFWLQRAGRDSEHFSHFCPAGKLD